MQKFTVTPPPAPVIDKEQALNALWAFVEGIGFEPSKVIAAFASHEALSLGLAVGATQAAVVPNLPADAARLFCTNLGDPS